MMTRASYLAGVRWIARDADAAELDPDELRGSPYVAMLAGMFDLSEAKVARDVLRAREKEASR